MWGCCRRNAAICSAGLPVRCAATALAAPFPVQVGAHPRGQAEGGMRAMSKRVHRQEGQREGRAVLVPLLAVPLRTTVRQFLPQVNTCYQCMAAGVPLPHRIGSMSTCRECRTRAARLPGPPCCSNMSASQPPCIHHPAFVYYVFAVPAIEQSRAGAERGRGGVCHLHGRGDAVPRAHGSLRAHHLRGGQTPTRPLPECGRPGVARTGTRRCASACQSTCLGVVFSPSIRAPLPHPWQCFVDHAVSCIGARKLRYNKVTTSSLGWCVRVVRARRLCC